MLRVARGAVGGTQMDVLCVNTIRTLCMDAVQQANSGHPGTPMGMAPVAYTLCQRFLMFDLHDPILPNRDRFVVSAVHASTLLYSLLHLTGVQAVDPAYETLGRPTVELEDLERFRQLDSRCPGHPEYRWTSGVETTTGPLGQGVATSVGMAIASQWLAAHFNRTGFEMFGFDVFALAGDGCIMEGVSSEAASLAGHLKLANLCWIYDNNHITIEGPTSLTFNDDVATRFISYSWNVTRVGDANDLEMVSRALDVFRNEADRPTLVIVDSHIGYGAPQRQDTREAHGEPLGEDEVRAAKRFYGWPGDAEFLVPEGVREHFAEGIGNRGRDLRMAWEAKLGEYRSGYPELADQIERMQTRRLPNGWDQDMPTFPADARGLSGRDASGQVLNAIARHVPWLIGGAADLAPSTKTRLTFEGAGDFSADERSGRNLHFGIREHAMGAVVNGLSLSKIRAFGAGFFIFSEYMRQPIRLAALMEIPVIYVFTHDSIGVGEDGPTHQPVEQLAALRSMPGLIVLRPGDANEVAEAWRLIIGAETRTRCARPLPPGHADAGPHAICARVRPRQGRLRACRLRAGRPGGHSDGDGHRGRPCGGRVRAAGRAGDPGACGQHALLGPVRTAAEGVPPRRAAAAGDGAGGGRAGRLLRLGPLRRPDRHGDRHAHLRHVRPAQRRRAQVRVHARAGGRGGEGPARPAGARTS